MNGPSIRCTSVTPRSSAPEDAGRLRPRLAVPAALGLLGQRIEALGDIGGGRLRLLGVLQPLGISAPAIAACSTTKRG